MTYHDGYIAVDWGTTNRRAYAVDRDGRVIDGFEDACGLTAIPRGGFDAAAAQITQRLGDQPMLLAGMVGSNRGWREAPYVPCPAGITDLAQSILWVQPGRIGIVPGVSQTGDAGADVMRGEEVQVLGAVAAGRVPPDCLICHPGTHAKWIEMRGGQIQSFRTMMTGELFSLLRKHSVLAEQIAGDVAADTSFREGVADGLAGEPLLHALFSIRARHVLGEEKGWAASYCSGLLIGSDVRAGLSLHRGGTIALIGRPELCDLYRVALQCAGHDTIDVDGAEAFCAGMQLLAEII